MKKTLFYIIVLFTISACNKNIHPDRSMFVEDGDLVPSVQLDKYKSVQQRPNQNPDLAVALAISGGGSRASNLGIGVMLGLEQILQQNNNNVLQEVDYLSTVSGGGFAGGAYVRSLFEHHHVRPNEPYRLQNYVDSYIRRDLKHSYMGSILKHYFNPKLWFTFADDGDALEKAVDNVVLGYERRQRQSEMPARRSMVLRDLFIAQNDTAEVHFPMMFANGAVMDNMAILPFSPDVLEQYQINGCTHRLKRQQDVACYDIPLSVGIKASGSFPVLISNTTLTSTFHPKRKYLHVVDGGLADNYGYKTALDVLVQDAAASKKVMFIIDANNIRNIRTFSKRQKGRNMFKVYAALPYSGLSARSTALKPEVYRVCEYANVTPFFFGFDALIANNIADPPEKIKVKEEQERLIGLLKADIHNISDEDLQILYELLNAIGTKYTISRNEQELLILGGQKIVFMQKDLILEALGE